ncbi:MAG TPA: lamin tail domain-containing protein [Kofleriaceae bacterium]|nr:lamin tail domain-containing protein [Kofleriaceae bacterium]
MTLALAAVAACGDNAKNPGGPPDAGGHPPPDTGGNPPPPPPTDTPPVTMACATLPPSTSTCDVTAGTSGAILLKGNVLTPGTVYTGGQVLVDTSGQIACVGCDCALGGETVVSCPDASISPGLINTHDHITFDQNAPVAASAERYDDRQQWRIGLDQHTKISPDGGATSDQISWAELRFLMGGATSIVGSGGANGLLRNLDKADPLQGGLGKPPVFFDTFPLDDTNGTRNSANCNYGTAPTLGAQIASSTAYEPHTSEGIDATAHNEFLCESSLTYDVAPPGLSQNLMRPQTAMIHAVGLNAIDYAAMAAAGTGLIWSPRSNISLYGDTARVAEAWGLGVQISLGTDWLPSGSSNLLRELSCADTFNKTYLHGYFRDDQLWRMVTSNAAANTAMDDKIGTLAQGKVADISIFAAHGKSPFRAVLEAESKDVALVMRAGKPLYGDAALLTGLAVQSCDTVDVCGNAKQVCLSSEINKTYTQLQTAAAPKTGTIYPAFACGVPSNEPTCTPTRPTAVAQSTVYTGEVSAMDGDGDGIPDPMDNCPTVFNPVRPMDGGAQPDADGDGAGDACDPCPLDANTTTCGNVDRDGDGVADKNDNCPTTSNPDQADADQDGKGDACDACPADANPGEAGCPTTIYKINSGATPVGSLVTISNALVTGRGSNGYFVQVKETDAGYLGADNSGLFIFTGSKPAASITIGSRVTVGGAVDNFHGELELDGGVITTVTSTTTEDPPAPVSVAYAEIKTNGPRWLKLDGVIVKVAEGTVTAVDGTTDFTLTSGSDSILVDGFVAPLTVPPVGTAFTSVTGILALRGQNVGGTTTTQSKIEPRGAADLVLGPPSLVSITPPTSTVRVGEDVTLTVTLSGAAQGDTAVAVTSGDPASLTVGTATVLNGQTTATVTAHGVAPAASVTVTATLGAVSKTATVQVIDVAQPPTVLTLTSDVTAITNGGVAHLTATLDLNAITDVVVGLAINPSDAGTLSASSITIPAGSKTATATFTDAATSGTVVITASATGFTDATVSLTAAGVSALDHLVISQVYGAGGNTGATLKSDFIEIHNPTNAPVSLAGMSVQYASSGGNFSVGNVTALPSVMLAPGAYFLVAESSGANGAALPAPDATGTIAMAAAAGKVALVSNATPIAGTGCPLPSAGVIDYVGYGSGGNCFEGGAPTAPLSAILSAQRAGNGCVDTNNNGVDFVAATPSARNTSSPAVACP